MAERTEITITARDETREAFRSVQAGLSGINASLGGLLGPLAALTSAAGFVGLIKSQVELGDQLNKNSQKLGVSVEKLSAYAYSAELANVSNETMTGGLTRLAANMQDAAINKGGEAARTFQALGVSVVDATGKLRPTSEVLEDISTRFESAHDGTAKTAAAVTLFGRSGVELIPMLNNLRETASEAERTGKIVSTEFAQSAEQFNDNLTKMSTSAGTLARVVAGPLVAALADLTEHFNVAIGAQEELSLKTLQIDRAKLGAEFVRLRQAGEKDSLRIRVLLQEIDELDAKIITANKKLADIANKKKDKTDIKLPPPASGRAGSGDSEQDLFNKYEVDLAKRSEILQQHLLSDEERYRLHYEKQQELLDEANMRGLIADQEYRTLSGTLKAQYEEQTNQADSERELLRLQERAGRIAQEYLTEEEQLSIHLTEKELILQDAYMRGLISEQEYEETLERMQQEHGARIVGIHSQRSAALMRLWQQGWRGQLQVAGDLFGQLGSLMQSKHESMFKIGKKAAIANALISTFAAVNSALETKPFFPLGLAMGGVAMAQGMANVAAIRSTNFGSGGNATGTFPANPSSGLPDVGGTNAGALPDLSAQAQPQQPERIVNVNIKSGIYSATEIRDTIIPEIMEAWGDGVGRGQMNVSVG